MQKSSIQNALRLLAVATKRCDPQHQGINFVLTRPDIPILVTLNLKNVTVREVLAHIPFAYKIGDFDVSLDYDNGCGLSSWTYLVSPKFFLLSPSIELDKEKGTFDVAKQLEAKGIGFAPGTDAHYTPATKTLRVVNTYGEVLAIDYMLNP